MTTGYTARYKKLNRPYTSAAANWNECPPRAHTRVCFKSTRRQRFRLPQCHIFLCLSSILARGGCVMDGGEQSTATTTALSSRSRHALLADDNWHVQLTAPPSDRYVTAADRHLPLATFQNGDGVWFRWNLWKRKWGRALCFRWI